jgi:hypothetical protein
MLPADTANSLPAFFIGKFGHRAGIDHAYIRPFPLPCLAYSVLCKTFADSGSFREIEFAAQRIIGGGFILKDCLIDHVLPVETLYYGAKISNIAVLLSRLGGVKIQVVWGKKQTGK